MRSLGFLTLLLGLGCAGWLASATPAHAFGRQPTLEGKILTGDACRTSMLARLGFSDAAPVSLQQTYTGVDLKEMAPCELELSMSESTGRTSYLNVHFKSRPSMWPYGAVPISRRYPIDSARQEKWACVENETAIQVTYEFTEDREDGPDHQRALTLEHRGEEMYASYLDDDGDYACRLRLR